MRIVLFCLTAVLGIGLAGAADLANDRQKTFYALGVAVSQSLGDFSLSEAELEIVKSGMTDGVLKRPLKVDMQTFGPKIQPLAEERTASAAGKEKAAGAAFLAKAGAEAGVKKTESGAIVKTLKEGTGASPAATDTVITNWPLVTTGLFVTADQRIGGERLPVCFSANPVAVFVQASVA